MIWCFLCGMNQLPFAGNGAISGKAKGTLSDDYNDDSH